MRQPKILVVGSFVKDLIVSTHVFPQQGETVLGCDFHMATGGKGANQAISAARLGAQVTMVGSVGDDSFGKDLVGACVEDKIDCSHVKIDPDHPSSIGNVQLLIGEDGSTQNRIIVVPGANMAITPEDVAFLEEGISQYDMVMLQLEIPMEINELVAKYARNKGVPVMLNTAPSDKNLSKSLLDGLDYLSCNEHEAEDLTGIHIPSKEEGLDLKLVQTVIQKILDMGVSHVLVTLGSAGAAFGDKDTFLFAPALENVTSVDPTGAGDSFTGGFCAFLAMGIAPETALRMANYVGALTVSVMGAQTSLPTLEQVEELFVQRGEPELRIHKEG